jgi:hypothetical protein
MEEEMSHSRHSDTRFDAASDYGRHVAELRRRARRHDIKARDGRQNERREAIQRNLKEYR